MDESDLLRTESFEYTTKALAETFDRRKSLVLIFLFCLDANTNISNERPDKFSCVPYIYE